MTKAEIEAVLERVKTWPTDRQRQIAEALIDLEPTVTEDVYRLSEDERRDIREGIAEADRGEFASDERVRAILAHRG